MNLTLPSIVGGDKEKKKKGSACVYLTEEQCRFPCRKVRSKRSNGKGRCRTIFSRKKYNKAKEGKTKKNKRTRTTSKSPQVTDDSYATDILQPGNTPQLGENNFVPEEVKESTSSSDPVVPEEPAVPDDVSNDVPDAVSGAVSGAVSNAVSEEADGEGKPETGPGTGDNAGPSFFDGIKETVTGFMNSKKEGDEENLPEEVKGGKKRKRSRRRSKKSSRKKSSRKK